MTTYQGRMGRGVRGIHGHPSFEISYAQSEKNVFFSEKIWGKIIERKRKKGNSRNKKVNQKKKIHFWGLYDIDL
jgi:hypothetical protein